MRYRLRTLLIVLAVGPPVLAGAWWGCGKWREEQARRAAPQKLKLPVIKIVRGEFVGDDNAG